MKFNAKKGLAICVTAVAATVFAEETYNPEGAPEKTGKEVPEVIDYGPRSYGWTAFALGLATPVQLPWGIDKWDVFGLDLNLGYSDAPRMFGWELALGANTARKDFAGLATALGFNYSDKDAYGLDISLFNMNNLEFYGMSVDAVGMNRNFYGRSVDALGNATDNEFAGLALAGLANVCNEDMYGAQIALACNLTRRVHGFQLALVYNQTSLLWGCQIALVNMAMACDHGFQIGLINVIMDNQVPFLPIVNGDS